MQFLLRALQQEQVQVREQRQVRLQQVLRQQEQVQLLKDLPELPYGIVVKEYEKLLDGQLPITYQ